MNGAVPPIRTLSRRLLLGASAVTIAGVSVGCSSSGAANGPAGVQGAGVTLPTGLLHG